MSDFDRLLNALQQTGYHQWMKSEGIPVAVGHGMEDVRDIKLTPWRRAGGLGSFVHLHGMEGITGMYVAEIPPGDALQPEKHLYEELICILDGIGATEVWQEGKKKTLFEWGRMSLFSPPLNSWHRLINGGREPVKFLAVTNAPMVLDAYRNPEFVFNNPFVFADRFAGEEGAHDNALFDSGRGRIHPTGFQLAAKLHEDGTTTSLKKGGTMIEYDDEDPAIRRRFEAELKQAGMRSDMPQVTYA